MNKRLTYSARIPFCKNPLAKKLLQLIDDKKSNLALSADVTSSNELIDLVDRVGSEICVLKTHIDIIHDFTPQLIQKLKQLSEKHGFFIFEDRKFADIGNTVKHQYDNGIYRIADWADMINAHSVPGPGVIQGLAEVGKAKQRGLLLIAELSSANHLINSEYMQKTLAMAETFSDFVFGFIAQRKLSDDNHWIYMTPGVQFGSKGDALGQQYVTPEKAIVENNSDIIIVGRGIYHHENPLQAAREYKKAGWDAYQSTL